MGEQSDRRAAISAAPLLVGREQEQAALHDALAATLAGRGSLVLISGEAGIGKTALAETICHEADRLGALVLVGRCYDLTETPPYGPWREVFARAPGDDTLPDLPTAVLPAGRDGEALGSQEAIITRVLAYLAAIAADHPVVLLLDDLHWADPASLDLLRVASRTLAEVPLLLLATYRAEEVARGRPLFALLPLLAREARAERLDLRPLDDEAIGALVAARYALPAADHVRLARYLAGRTEGNALFLGELLRTLESEGVLNHAAAGWGLGDLAAVPVPTLLRQVIAGRLHRLSQETERLLAIAAVIGQAVPLALWAAVAETDEDALFDHSEQATAARLLIEAPDGTGVVFAHALIREALYEGTPAPRRRAWHRRAGEALVAAPSPDPDALANQFQRAGDPRAVEWLVRAGLRAMNAGARLTAGDRFAAAAGLLAEDEARTRERGWLAYCEAAMLVFADTARALRQLDEADRLAQRVGDRALAAHGHFMRGGVLCHHRRLRDGLVAMEQGVADLDELPGDDRDWQLNDLTLARLGALFSPDDRLPRPRLRLRASVGAATLSERGTLSNWYGWLGHYREARAVGKAARDAALTADPSLRAVPGRWGLAHACAALGQLADAQREYALGLEDTYGRNDLYSVAYVIFAEMQHLTLPYFADDLPMRARLLAAEARAWATVQETVIAAPYPSQAAVPVALLEGRWAEARRLAEAGVAFATVGHAQSAGAALGMLARHQGDSETAWAQIRVLHPAGPDTAPGDCFFLPGSALQALAAELALDAGDLATAARWIVAHDRWLAWSGAVLWQAEHQLLIARHARLSGDQAAALAHARAALVRASEPRQPRALLAAHRLLGELGTEAGRHPEAQEHLEAAQALADACAAPYERALTLLALADLRAATGDRDAAHAALTEARAICEPLAAAPALTRADALAARLAAATAPDAVPMVPFGLTAREMEVLRLAAQGLTDPQIGELLFVSRNTVNTHLRAVYGKLGVNTRTAAARFAAEHGLI